MSQLIVTTAVRVYAWDTNSDEVFELFTSGSNGIVAAKYIAAGGLLAVADSLVIVLHDVGQGMQQSYRLKDRQGPVQTLYYDQRYRRLFYTTALLHAVQVYSLQENILLDPAPTHPSPPTVFALSEMHNTLLSTSAIPPTILVTNLTSREAPVHMQPGCSTSAVVAAAFHPGRGEIFALAYADGTLAVYDLNHLWEERAAVKHNIQAARYGEITHIAKLHVLATAGCPLPGPFSTSITAVAFIPGSRCTTVSVGADGKCCVVDFEPRVLSKSAAVYRQWHVNGPATVIAINDVEIAIGREDGTVLLYDIGGQLLRTRIFGPGQRILDLEWLQFGGKALTLIKARQSDTIATRAFTVQNTANSVSTQKVIPATKLPAPASVVVNRIFKHTDRTSQPSLSVSGARVSLGSSPERKVEHVVLQTPQAHAVAVRHASTSSDTVKRPRVRSRRVSKKGPPVVPPRPVPKNGRSLAQSRTDARNMASFSFHARSTTAVSTSTEVSPLQSSSENTPISTESDPVARPMSECGELSDERSLSERASSGYTNFQRKDHRETSLQPAPLSPRRKVPLNSPTYFPPSRQRTDTLISIAGAALYDMSASPPVPNFHKASMREIMSSRHKDVVTVGVIPEEPSTTKSSSIASNEPIVDWRDEEYPPLPPQHKFSLAPTMYGRAPREDIMPLRMPRKRPSVAKLSSVSAESDKTEKAMPIRPPTIGMQASTAPGVDLSELRKLIREEISLAFERRDDTSRKLAKVEEENRMLKETIRGLRGGWGE